MKLHLCLTSALGGGDWSTSRPGRFTPSEKPSVSIGGWVGPKAGRHVNGEEEKLLPLLEFELRTVQSLASLITQYVLPSLNNQITTLLHGVSNFVPVYTDGGLG